MPELIEDLADSQLRRAVVQAAADSLPFRTARLYSQHIRLRAGRLPLPSWRPSELEGHLAEVIATIEGGEELNVRKDEREAAFRRAGELLEWLDHAALNPDDLPLGLLGAACYQVAGLPARARILATSRELSAASATTNDAPLLRLLLAGDLGRLLLEAADAASAGRRALETRQQGTVEYWFALISTEIASALGVLAASFRWGQEARTDAALRKLVSCASALRIFGQPYAWLLAKLSAEVARLITDTSLRGAISMLSSWSGEWGSVALENYLRQRFIERRSLAWPSQLLGIQRLAEGGSFALCTPTGSGKTTVAEVALLDGLFRDGTADGEMPLCLYIVPTRALAAEVESKLGRVLISAGGARPVTVTGLYGGTDWGPSDGWLTSEEPTVLICTQEKAEALVRFLGWTVVSRLGLVIIDEAHEVTAAPQAADLRKGESRSLRLETLVARLKALRPHAETRFIAMSAVADSIETPLAQWMSDDPMAVPARSEYRSTRQAIGRLRCSRGRTQIFYDVLDGRSLTLRGSDLAPYVPQPFPEVPESSGMTGPQKSLAPYALWAALNLASEAEGRRGQSVLISITSGVRNWATWSNALFSQWSDVPAIAPDLTSEGAEALFEAAHRAFDDYFGEKSLEAELLSRGVIVHYGRMPGRLPRLLVQLIERRAVRVVLATSGLSQGVNLPFETVLIPMLRRQNHAMGRSEFWNLAGRAGRPGVATEGQTLVLVNEDETEAWRRRQVTSDYAALTSRSSAQDEEDGGARPLADLLGALRQALPEATDEEFLNWLEATITIDVPDSDPIVTLDTLDGILLAALEEAGTFEDPVAAEIALRRFWRSSFSFHASREEERLEAVILTRGETVRRRFESEETRRMIYRSSLPPRAALQLQTVATRLREHLAGGDEYARWSRQRRLEYVLGAVEVLAEHPRFSPRATVGNTQATWRDVLTWWLEGWDGDVSPTSRQIGPWHDFISVHFTYRFTWALGSALSVIGNESDVLGAGIDLSSWTETGLPWSSIWLKDLIEWGTLEPVAAYLLARGGFATRPDAEGAAAAYYSSPEAEAQTDPLAPDAIRAWARQLRERSRERTAPTPQGFAAELATDFPAAARSEAWTVVPVAAAGEVRWLDAAGRQLATTALGPSATWDEQWPETMNFELYPAAATVNMARYV